MKLCLIVKGSDVVFSTQREKAVVLTAFSCDFMIFSLFFVYPDNIGQAVTAIFQYINACCQFLHVNVHIF